ncbi:MAG: lysostaphin resistance A-like protein [Gaiellaceae bacterium]
MKDRGRLIGWTSLVLFLAALNYSARFTGGGRTSDNNAVYSYSQFAGGIVVYALWLGAVLWIAAGRRDLLALRRTTWKWAVLGPAGAFVLIIVVEALVSQIPLPQSPGREQGLTPTHWEPAHAGAFAANVVLFAVIAPFVEELTFRGVGQSLLRFLGRWPSILLVGISFGVAHGLVEALLVLVPFGIVLAYLRDRATSIYPGMAVHAAFNALALAVSVLR